MAADRAAVLRAQPADGPLRPILTFLNGDNSWLISFPRPAKERQSTGKAYFHAVADPWLIGESITFASWLVRIVLPESPAIKDAADIDNVIRAIEDAAPRHSDEDRGVPEKPTSSSSSSSLIDAIFISIHLHDHFHEPTCRTLDRDIPIFAPKDAVSEIRAMNHFTNVIAYGDLDAATGDWQTLHPGAHLPAWLSVFRLVGNWQLNWGTAMIWTRDDGEHEALLWSPHGIQADSAAVQTFGHGLRPAVASTLALLTTLKDSTSILGLATLGVKGGLAVDRVLRPKYWVRTGDAHLEYYGLIMKMIGVRDTWGTMRAAVDEENERARREGREERGMPNYVEVENGGCFVLA